MRIMPRSAPAGRLSLAIVVIALLSAALAPGAMAQPAYEPNDSLLTAYGPLANNSSYVGADETENDVDFFYFYVTTPSTAQLTFTITNLGGGSGYENEINAMVTNSHGYRISFIGDPEIADYATKSITLEAGKYYVEVWGDGGYGSSYRLSTSGTDGAFGDYATIAANCAAATAPVNVYQAQLATAQARLRAAANRLRKARNSGNRRAKRRAVARYLRVKATVGAEKRSLKAAEAGQRPWCFIPQ
ncbi:MAG: hypothetical protein M3335_07400 [Actinomycetota bacterium]|nr:hypothetical protein [Actinomycetota bacterium]